MGTGRKARHATAAAGRAGMAPATFSSTCSLALWALMSQMGM